MKIKKGAIQRTLSIAAASRTGRRAAEKGLDPVLGRDRVAESDRIKFEQELLELEEALREVEVARACREGLEEALLEAIIEAGDCFYYGVLKAVQDAAQRQGATSWKDVALDGQLLTHCQQLHDRLISRLREAGIFRNVAFKRGKTLADVAVAKMTLRNEGRKDKPREREAVKKLVTFHG